MALGSVSVGYPDREMQWKAHTVFLKVGECAWQAHPTVPFVASPRSGTRSVRVIHTRFGSARVSHFNVKVLHTDSDTDSKNLLSRLVLDA